MNYNITRIKYFESIPAEPDKGMILTRLGYKKNTTVLDEKYREMLEEGLRLGEVLCRVKGAYGRFDIVERNTGFIKLENGVALESESLSRLLEKSSEAVLMSSTAGSKITERIGSEVGGGNAAFGLILDSTASETADAGLDWIMDFLNKVIAKEGKKLTRLRYSPGYGDLPLSNQRKVFDALKLEKIGLYLTENYMLVPEKSVIAIAGIEGVERYDKGRF